MMKEKNTSFNILHWTFSIVFMILLCIPVIIMIVDDTPQTNKEKRKLAQIPELKFTKDFSKQFSSYFDDHFGTRKALIAANSSFKLSFLGVSPRPEKAIFGAENFLFHNNYKEDPIFASYTNNNLLPKELLAKKFAELEKRNLNLAEKGIRNYYCFWPNKHTIESANLPFVMSAQINRSKGLADQIMDYSQTSRIPILDSRDFFRSENTREQLYNKFDTHWNAQGAFAGYQFIMKNCFPNDSIPKFVESDFDIVYKKENKGDLITLLGLDSLTTINDSKPIFTLKDKNYNYEVIEPYGINHEIQTTRNEHCGNNIRLLFLGDSYTYEIMQFISLSFYEVIYVKGGFKNNIVELVKPDIIISSRVERFVFGEIKTD